jgi:hypothetical protein
MALRPHGEVAADLGGRNRDVRPCGGPDSSVPLPGRADPQSLRHCCLNKPAQMLWRARYSETGTPKFGERPGETDGRRLSHRAPGRLDYPEGEHGGVAVRRPRGVGEASAGHLYVKSALATSLSDHGRAARFFYPDPIGSALDVDLGGGRQPRVHLDDHVRPDWDGGIPIPGDSVPLEPSTLSRCRAKEQATGCGSAPRASPAPPDGSGWRGAGGGQRTDSSPKPPSGS